ncbi:MAG: transketolase [Lachnospiraceae bacterium]|nr:transketolase [Lachnospiraceae bacterium]
MSEKMFDPRKTFGKAVTDLAEADNRIVVLSADSGKSSGFSDFMEKYPERYFECGIMEQGVVGISSGLATTGKIPVFCAIAPFVTARPFEMFRNDLGYMNQNAKIVGRNCGITYSDLGATHHSLDDFALMRMIPGVVILAPQDPNEIIDAVSAMIEYEGPVYMRIGNPKIKNLYERQPVVIGKGRKICEGDAITLITTGSTTAFAMEAVQELAKEGVYVEHIGLSTVWPIDKELIIESAQKTKRVIVVEEHYVKGGLSTIVLEMLNENEVHVPVIAHGIPHDYASNGSYEELMSYYKLDSKGIKGIITNFIKEDK